ncbi:MAG: ATP-binding cassette domain-containing protein, partial [Chlamydiae bacterium]|nr:ATP-binding cassette domain-containing protein [Chlamydiota bacterium]
DLSNLNLKELRKQIGVVLQNGAVFSGTLYDNIVCGGTYTIEEVMHAIEIANFKQDLDKLGMGLHTLVQPETCTLSNGEIQRLLIARALIAKPKILIMDEATNCLDNTSQDVITKNIDDLNVTRIVIAHRLSTIIHATRIYVIDKGTIVQEGTFDELYQQEGLFKYLIHEQAKQMETLNHPV